MLSTVQSPAEERSKSFAKSPFEPGEDNLSWLARHLADADLSETSAIILVGGRDTTAFRLRVAQSHLRHDMSPSHWSHIALVTPPEGGLEATVVREISLQPPGGFGFPPEKNGVQENTLAAYRSPWAFPNIALMFAPISAKKAEAGVERFKKQRAVVDSPALIVRWLAFAWGAGKTGNPLLDHEGIPSAAFVEAVIASAGFDLTPGLESRAACPEAIWQAALWWPEYYRKTRKVPLRGAWCVNHKLVETAEG